MGKQKIIEDIKVLLNDSEELLRLSASLPGEGVDALRTRLRDVALEDAQASAQTRYRAGVDCTEKYVKDNPWQSIGIAAGVGFLLGLLRFPLIFASLAADHNRSPFRRAASNFHRDRREHMARPMIRIFGALFAVGSVLAWKWVQSRDAVGRRTARDLSRWEEEGGKVLTLATGTRAQAVVNGHGEVSGTPDAWHFPRS
ncbi:MAG: hypothetical protein CBHOC_2090 [uncultured Caballeronia sp.]|nr:MAG: hypothetical protein CBHOC_2090 [uncultured Caballeronia sp.]